MCAPMCAGVAVAVEDLEVVYAKDALIAQIYVHARCVWLLLTGCNPNCRHQSIVVGPYCMLAG